MCLTAVLGAVGAGASLLGSSASNRANTAATNATLQASRESLAAQEKAQNDANTNLSPFITSGFQNSNVLNALLGMPGYDNSTANDAFNGYLSRAGFNTALGEENKAANAQFAASGALDSGAAVKSAQDRYLGLKGNYLNNYMSYLGNQQGVGLSAASASAGVAQNYANNLTNTTMNTGNTLGNLALQRGQNTNALLGNLSSSFGLGAGGLSGFGKVPGGGIFGGSPNYDLNF